MILYSYQRFSFLLIIIDGVLCSLKFQSGLHYASEGSGAEDRAKLDGGWLAGFAEVRSRWRFTLETLYSRASAPSYGCPLPPHSRGAPSQQLSPQLRRKVKRDAVAFVVISQQHSMVLIRLLQLPSTLDGLPRLRNTRRQYTQPRRQSSLTRNYF
jgi:hypothetical protein